MLISTHLQLLEISVSVGFTLLSRQILAFRTETAPSMASANGNTTYCSSKSKECLQKHLLCLHSLMSELKIYPKCERGKETVEQSKWQVTVKCQGILQNRNGVPNFGCFLSWQISACRLPSLPRTESQLQNTYQNEEDALERIWKFSQGSGGLR